MQAEVVTGFVKCVLCPSISLRRYALGRKFTKHLERDHPDDDHVFAVEESSKSVTAHCAPLLSELPKEVPQSSGSEKTTITLSLDDGLSLMDAGKGVTAGFVKCPLCTVKSMKRYAFGRGFSAHLNFIHPGADHTQAVIDCKTSLSAPGYDRNGNIAVDYKDCLPNACQLAKVGDLINLQKIDDKLIQSEGDKFGANALDWAAGEGHLNCVAYLVPLFPLKINGAAADDDIIVTTMRRRDGKSCLHWCCRNGHIDVMDYLLEHLYTPEALHTLGTGDGTTPVHIACFGGNVPLLQHMYTKYYKIATTTVSDDDKCEQDDIGHVTSDITSNNHDKNNNFHHQNNWGCLPEHFACMSINANPQLFQFLVDIVHSGDYARAAKYFFCSINSEGMTPVHKWLLYMSKDGREVEESLKWLGVLRLKLPEDEAPVPANGDVVSWIQERCGYLVGRLERSVQDILMDLMGCQVPSLE
jgi:ankyrin repeat protein